MKKLLGVIGILALAAAMLPAQGYADLRGPFALVSNGKEDRKYYLEFAGTVSAEGTAPTVDHYRLVLAGKDYDVATAITRGVAIGLETSTGAEVFLQKDGDGYKAY